MVMNIMRIIEPRHFKAIKPEKPKRHYFRYLFILLVLVSIGYVGYTRFNRPLPAPTVINGKALSAGPEVKFDLPDYGQAAVGIVGVGIVNSNNTDEPVPIASTAKVITALVVQDKQRLEIGQTGPDVEITKADRQIYDKYYMVNGAIVPVLPGSKLSQKALMQAMLIPSANNMADTLTNSVFGSQEEYVVYANKLLKDKGFTKTTVADSSGFSPDTKSTAAEMVRIGELAMLDPVISQIVGQSQAAIPNGGIVRNTNWLLGQQGVNGIKTGNTNEAGGCFMVSAVITHPDKTKSTVVAAILGAKTVSQAMTDIQPVVFNQAKAGFKDKTVVRAGQQLGVIQTAWGERAAITAEQDLSLFGWQEDVPSYKLELVNDKKISDLKPGQKLGQAQVTLGKNKGVVNVEQTGSIQPPDFWWKFRRIFQSQ